MLNRLGAAGEDELLARLDEFIAHTEWFPLHAQSMDTVLALFVRQTGFDAAARAGPRKHGAP
ncbi:MAG: hypothetical protein HYY78_09900 [Betaproteobacteria bacterium]|nr:hypothetical protein [Betaproteobacteria bacterium]